MGRWAQRVRGGGTVNTIQSMQSAVTGGGGSSVVTITYPTALGLTSLNAADFQVQGGGEIGDNVSGISGNTISIDFLVDVSGSSQITYSGNAVNFRTPQTITKT